LPIHTAAAAVEAADASRCGGHLATRNELPPFPGHDSNALLFLFDESQDGG